jgi:hypothetical protein
LFCSDLLNPAEGGYMWDFPLSAFATVCAAGIALGAVRLPNVRADWALEAAASLDVVEFVASLAAANGSAAAV